MASSIIVGGSKGIGRSILANLVEEGTVHNFSRSKPELNHPNLQHYDLNITEDELPEIENVTNLVYCPGSITLKPIGSLKEADFISDFNINVLGAVKVIKHYLKSMKRTDNASIVLFSTVAVSQGMPFHSSIAVAKAGVEALTKSLAAELAPNIRVNCIAPSVTNTPLAQGLLRNEKAIENIKNRHPLKFILEAQDVANMANFLLSEKAKGITGQIMAVDSGLSTLKL